MNEASALTPYTMAQTEVRTAPPFVGRRQQLHWFAQRLQDSRDGQAQVVLLAGDIGVGKTRLIEQVRDLAQNQDMQVYHCRCDEEMTLPYLPWVRNFLAEIVQLLEESQGELQTEVETIRGFLHQQGDGPSAPTLSPSAPTEHDQLRLFVAVSRLVIHLARQTPILLIMDDLHWADGPSLELFSDIAFTIADAAASVPLLLVGTYVPLLAGAPLLQALARYQREPIYHTMTLHGFDDRELRAFLQALGLPRPSQQLLTAVRTTTQGNAVFVQEVMHVLHTLNTLEERGGSLVTTLAPDEVPLPSQVTSTLTARLETLSPRTRDVLTQAAYLGGYFASEQLCAVSTYSVEEVFGSLEEGLQQHLLLEDGTYWQFVHPLLRHVLYTTPSLPRRQWLHRHIAQALERLYADNIAMGLDALVHHWNRAGVHTTQAVAYARQAGDLAFERCAWGDAARHYEAALTLAVSADSITAQERAALHYWAGLAHFRAQDFGLCLHHYTQAEHVYGTMQDTLGIARVLLAQARARMLLAATSADVLEETQRLGRLLPTLGTQDLLLRGNLVVVMAELSCAVQETDTALHLAQQALEIGQQMAEPGLCAVGCLVLGQAQNQRKYSLKSLESWQRGVHYAQQRQDSWLHGQLLVPRLQLFLALGRFDDATTAALEVQALTTRTQDWNSHLAACATLAAVALARGEFAVVEQTVGAALAVACHTVCPWESIRGLTTLACARMLGGAWSAAEEALDLLLHAQGGLLPCPAAVQPFVQLLRLCIQAHANRQAAEPLAPLATLMHDPLGCDAYILGPLGALLDYAQQQGTPQVAALAYPALSFAVQRGILFSSASGWLCLLPRLLGVAAALQGQRAVAENHFNVALSIATQTQAMPELARTYLDYARLLVTHRTRGNHRHATECLQQAQRLFQACDMPSFAQQAAQLLHHLQHKVSLRAEDLPQEMTAGMARDLPPELPEQTSDWEDDRRGCGPGNVHIEGGGSFASLEERCAPGVFIDNVCQWPATDRAKFS